MIDALRGLRVLELTTAWSGPFVGRFLGAFGAEVVKFESAGAVDIWRGPFPLGWGTRNVAEGTDPGELSVDVAPNFNSLNRNKLGVAIDLSTNRGRELFLGLANNDISRLAGEGVVGGVPQVLVNTQRGEGS